MNNLKDFLISENVSIKKALEVIDNGTMRIAIVVDNCNRLLGIINDGDIRRALLKGYSLNMSIIDIYQRNPSVCKITDTKEHIIKTAIKNKVYQIPIINESNIVVYIEDLATLLSGRIRKNKVVIMAGGLGTRLKPLTDDIPKPLLKVGTKPILETIIENFANYGFKEIIISVNYKANMIKEYFKDGSDFGVKISYLEEDRRLGTAGALSLIKEEIKEPFFVMNGDLLTNINFEHLLNFHLSSNSIATMCVREYEYQIPYGVIQIEKDEIRAIEEKPINKFFVNAGIYLLSNKVLNYIPKDTFYDMPTLFQKLINEELKILSFPIHEYWLDIGRIVDYERANDEYSNVFKE